MKDFKLLIASMALTGLAMFPVTSIADDELDVTMDVIENLAEIEGVILEMDVDADGGIDEGDDREDGTDHWDGDDDVNHDGEDGGADQGDEDGRSRDGEDEGNFDDEPSGEDGFEHDE